MQASLSSKPPVALRGAALLVALAASACGPQYEIDRAGTWRPTGANDFNLRAMAADPRDLASGAASTTDRGNGAARAVSRLYVDRRRPLLDVSLTTVAPSTGGQDSGGGGGGTASPGGSAQ